MADQLSTGRRLVLDPPGLRDQADQVRFETKDSCLQLAQEQGGVITRGQALELGLTPDAIRQQVRAGRWQGVRRGVYVVFSGPMGREAVLWVELDGSQAHPEDQRWQDLRRINAITAEGVIILRYGWIDVTSRPCETAAQVGAVLVGLGWTGPLRRCGPNCRIAEVPPSTGSL